MQRTQAPERRQGKLMGDDYSESHPAFACCEVGHWHSSYGVRLFGSDLVHTSGISLTFKTAISRRAHGATMHHGHEHLLRVELSHSQWAQLVAARGLGDGVPVTLTERRLGDWQQVPAIAPPEGSVKDRHASEMERDLKAALAKVADSVKRLQELADQPGSVPKTELRERLREAAIVLGNMPANYAFAFEQFARATEAAADQAKAEVEGFVASVANKLGVEAIADLPRLAGMEQRGEGGLTPNL